MAERNLNSIVTLKDNKFEQIVRDRFKEILGITDCSYLWISQSFLVELSDNEIIIVKTWFEVQSINDNKVRRQIVDTVLKGATEEYLEGKHLTSDNELACLDHCMYDAGVNCIYCERFPNTEFAKKTGGKHGQ